jgi:hypothetical protein
MKMLKFFVNLLKSFLYVYLFKKFNNLVKIMTTFRLGLSNKTRKNF